MTTVIMHTTEGDIKIDLFDDKTPETVANFLGLATGGEWADPFTGQPSHKPFYRWSDLHRIIKGFHEFRAAARWAPAPAVRLQLR